MTSKSKTRPHSPVARSSDFESVGAILARVIEQRGEAVKQSLEQAARSNDGRAEGRERREDCPHVDHDQTRSTFQSRA